MELVEKKGTLKKETEGMLMAAQDQALRTNYITKIVDKQDVSSCGEREETITRIVAECSKLAQKQYKVWRHDIVAMMIHWLLCKRIGFQQEEK